MALIRREDVWALVGDHVMTVRPGSKLEWLIHHYENAIDGAPEVDAVSVVHARWIYKERHRKSYRQYTGFDDMSDVHTITVMEESEGKEPYCSACGAQAAESFMNYCPHCGAKMDGEWRDSE